MVAMSFPHLRFYRFPVLVFLLSLALAACSPGPVQPAASIQLEEHALAAPPATDQVSFQPLDGSQEEILARHAAEREKAYRPTTTDVAGNPALLPNGEACNLVALLTTGQNPPEQSVQVQLAGAPIFTAGAGLPSPLLPLRGLWCYGGHWALEVLFTNETMWAGQVYVDGELLNEAKGYDEAYGFQLLSGKPFYFYQKDGHTGYSYDGQETDLEYDQIPHYYCCGETALNPVQAEDMVAFFAQKGEDWYYVELGDFGG
jgi:hypothetical protein